MSNSYSLDDLKRDLDKEFAPVEIQVGNETVVLRNLMRIGEKEREAVLAALNEMDKVDPEREEQELSPEEMATLTGAVNLILETVADKGKGKKLVAAINGDLALAMRVLEKWIEATQPGEAQNSPA